MSFKDAEKNAVKQKWDKVVEEILHNEIINQLKAKIQEKIRVANEMLKVYNEYHYDSGSYRHGEWSGKVEILTELLEEL